MNPPHMPYGAVPKKYQKYYENISMASLTKRPNIPPEGSRWGNYYRKNIRNYYAMMTGVDEQFGRILKALKENGLKNNTIVLFTSDHGNQLGIHNNISKSTPQEESVRVPFIIRYPGTIKPRQDSLLLSTPDIYPTLLDLMGMENKIPAQVEGKSYAQNFINGKGKRPDFQLYIEPGHPEIGRRGLRTNGYTFVMNNNKKIDNSILFFNNNQDPYQLHNISDDRPQLVKQFKIS